MTFSPCGMGMDVARSCSITNWTFFTPQGLQLGNQIPGNPPNAFGMAPAPVPTVRVRWYFCDPKAKIFPDVHCWGSTDFLDETERAATVMGEDPYFSEWNNGNRPAGAVGKKFCGKLEDFQNPKPFNPLALTLERGANGLPTCCTSDVTNLIAIAPPLPDVPSEICPLNGIPRTLAVTFTNSAALPLLNGLTYTITYDPTAITPGSPPTTPGGWVGSYVNPYTGYTVQAIWYLRLVGLSCINPIGPGQDYAYPPNDYPIECGVHPFQDGFFTPLFLPDGRSDQVAYHIQG